MVEPEKESCPECKESKPCHYQCKNPDIPQATQTSVVMDIDTLAQWCGYFTDDVETNNGYGCTHPAQEDKEENEDGIMQGRCLPFSCPIACELSPSDEPLDRVYFPDATEKDFEGREYDGEMLVYGMFKSTKKGD